MLKNVPLYHVAIKELNWDLDPVIWLQRICSAPAISTWFLTGMLQGVLALAGLAQWRTFKNAVPSYIVMGTDLFSLRLIKKW